MVLCLAAIMVASITPVSALAASIGSDASNPITGTDIDQGVKTRYSEIVEGNFQTQVYLTVDESDLIASLPTTVVLSGTPDEQGQYIGNYSLGVSGSMAGNKSIVIEPDSENIELRQKGKNSKTATVTQEQTKFTTDDFKNKTQTNGVITADKLTAGSWNSDFNFNIGVNVVKDVLRGYSTLYKYDLSATKNDDVCAYYCVPNKNTQRVDVPNDGDSGNGSHYGKMSKIRKMFSRAATESSENENYVEYNGVKYYLSDEDTIVIQGTGNMKNEVWRDFYDYKGIQDRTNANFMELAETIEIRWAPNTLYPECYDKETGERNTKKEEEVNAYINSLNNKVITPKNIVIKDGVTNVSTSAFNNCKQIKSAIIAGSVNTIQNSAFQNCSSLTDLTIENGVGNIGNSAFQDSALIKVDIPESVKTIGGGAFWNCKSLVTATTHEGLETIGNDVFAHCTSLKSLKFPNSLTSVGSGVCYNDTSLKSVEIGSGMTKLETSDKSWEYRGFFRLCKSLDNIVIPDNITVIDYDCFRDCTNLKNITLGNKTTTICANAFNGCTSLDNVIIPESVKTIGGSAFRDCKGLVTLTTHEGLTTIGNNAFQNCTSLIGSPEGLNIPSSITEIGDYAFNNCQKLENVTIHEGVTSLGIRAFAHCYSLLEFRIPNSVTSIGNALFLSDRSLKRLTIGTGVKGLLGGRANQYYEDSGGFAQGCTSLDNVIIPDNVTSINDYAFNGCSSLKNLVIEDGVTYIGNNAFQNCASLIGSESGLDIPASVKTIGDYTFTNCEKLKNVTLHEGLTSIGIRGFAYCSSLLEFKMPNSVTSIGNALLLSDKSLNKLTIGTGVKELLGGRANQYYENSGGFAQDCTSLDNVIIPDNVTSINDYAFNGCSSLKNLVIEDGVTYIGNNAFQNCTSLIGSPEGLNIPNTVTEIGNLAFANCTSLIKLTFPDSLTTVGSGVCYNDTSLKTVKIGSGMNALETYDKDRSGSFLGFFKQCKSLDNVVIPDNITTIDYDCFRGCVNLKNITLGNNTTTICANAFNGCENLNSLVIPHSVTSIADSAFDGTGHLTVHVLYIDNVLESYVYKMCVANKNVDEVTIDVAANVSEITLSSPAVDYSSKKVQSLFLNNPSLTLVHFNDKTISRDGFYNYTQVEYIESTGTQWIDTNIALKNDYNYEVEFSIPHTTSADWHMMGSDPLVLFGCYNSKFRLVGNTGSAQTILYENQDTDKHKIIIGKYCYFDNKILINGTNVQEDTNRKFFLFASQNNSNRNTANLSPNSKFIIYNCVIKNTINNKILRDMVPVLDGLGTPCLYDKVSGRYFYNQGTGDFLKP